MKCPHCQEENPSGHRYCSACGYKLPQNDVNEASPSKGKMIASRILSICSVPFGCSTGLLGLAMGIVGRALDEKRQFRTLWMLGIVFGSITLGLVVTATIVLSALAVFYGPEIVERFARAAIAVL